MGKRMKRARPDDAAAEAMTTGLRIRVLPSISELPAAAWDACANPGLREPGPALPYNPFVAHDFLAALEISGSAVAKAGWQPQHLALEDESGAVLGVVPCYLKTHSRGEYVFDRGWADAYERAGGDYYPKLQVSVPFMPAREWNLLAERGFLKRTDQQFHWENAGYGSFEDFLGALASRKRKVLKRERREALANGIEVDWLTGSDLTEAVWDDFFAFYMDTGSRKWGRPYLTREFFSLVGEKMADRILLVMAKRAGRYIAGAINFIGSDTVFGLHWGAVE